MGKNKKEKNNKSAIKNEKAEEFRENFDNPSILERQTTNNKKF